MWLATLALIAFTQAPTTPLMGVVVGTKGEPVAGAEVILLDVPRAVSWRTLARGKTGEDGKFSLDRPAGLVGEATDQSPLLGPGLWVVKPGLYLSLTRFPRELPAAQSTDIPTSEPLPREVIEMVMDLVPHE